MIQKIALVVLFCLSFVASAQTNEELETPEIYTEVESMPVFPGCESEASLEAVNSCTENKIIQHIGTETTYPEEAKKKGISGTVYIRYIVNEDGEVRDVEVVRGVQNGKILDKEAIRVIYTLPKMSPGIQDGKAVRVQYTIPIKFNLTGGKKKKKSRK